MVSRPDPPADRPQRRARILWAIGLAGVLCGLIVAAIARIADVRPASSGFVVPILLGAQAIFLGGLAMAFSLPTSRRPAIVNRGGLIMVTAIWSTATVAALAGGSELLRPVLSPVFGAVAPVRDGVILILVSAFTAGLVAMLYGVLYTIGAIGLAILRRLAALVRGQARWTG